MVFNSRNRESSQGVAISKDLGEETEHVHFRFMRFEMLGNVTSWYVCFGEKVIYGYWPLSSDLCSHIFSLQVFQKGPVCLKKDPFCPETWSVLS